MKGKQKKALSHIEENLPDISSDQTMMGVIWQNLIDNAFKYSQKKENPEISIWAEVDRTGVTYFIKDNGSGFDMRHYQKLFGIFQRLHSQQEFDGTGVGLANVQRTINKHNGTIFRSWRAGQRCHIPILFTLLKTLVMNKENTIDLLLVEDRQEDAELALMALEKHKLLNNIKWVRDGQEALDFLFCEGQFSDRKNVVNPKLTLLDLKMPKVSGLEVIEAVRSNPQTKTIPTVALTTSREHNDRLDANDLEANSYIVKPVDYENFSTCVRELGFYCLLLNESQLK